MSITICAENSPTELVEFCCYCDGKDSKCIDCSGNGSFDYLEDIYSTNFLSNYTMKIITAITGREETDGAIEVSDLKMVLLNLYMYRETLTQLDVQRLRCTKVIKIVNYAMLHQLRVIWG